MAALEHFQHKVAHLPGVKVVIGPQAATKRVEPLQELGNSVLASRGNIGPVKELAKLGKELNVAAGGVAALREGIAEASNGAGLLAQGSDHATEGAALIASGLARAAGGSGRAIDALERFAKGSEELTEGLLQAEIGAIQLRVTGINSITNVLNYNGRRLQREQLRGLRAEQNETLPRLLAPTEASVEKLQAAEAKLKEAAPTDPAAAAALESVQGGAGGDHRHRPGDRAALRRRLRGPGRRTRRAAGTVRDVRRTEPGNDRLHPLDDPRIAQGRARRRVA